MTLSIAWVRTLGDCQELVVATDSRLRAGYAWDSCPKIIILPRSDSVICFAGHTEYAYPLMLQMRYAIEMYPKSLARATDINKMKGHTLRVFNHMIKQMTDLPFNVDEAEDPKTFFILAGYSWIEKEFKIWLLHYDNSIKKFTFRSSRQWKGVKGYRLLAITGHPHDVVEEAKKRLVNVLRDRDLIDNGNFDMEPFEVLRDMIRENISPHVGGPPQLVKVYQHMNCTPFAVFWPNRQEKSKALLGRPLMHYESIPYPILDPDTLKIHHLFQLNKDEAYYFGENIHGDGAACRVE